MDFERSEEASRSSRIERGKRESFTFSRSEESEPWAVLVGGGGEMPPPPRPFMLQVQTWKL